MRIAFDAKRAFNNNTGLGNYSRSTINGCTTMFPEHEYLLYTSSTGRQKHYAPPSGTKICLPPNRWPAFLNGIWRTFALTKQLTRDGVDLFHGLSNEIPAGIGQSNIKSVVTIHDLIFMRYPRLYPLIDRRIYMQKVRHAVQAADRIIAVSQQTRNDLIELTGADANKIRVIYQDCHPWFYEKMAEESLNEIRKKYRLPNRYLLYVGTIEERKDLLTLVRALHEKGIDYPLVAVGRKTAYYDQVKKYLETNRIRQVSFYEHIANEDLPGVYQQSDLFIYPSRYEGFGIPVLEALNSGIPVITTRGSCLEETAGPGGLFFNAGDAEELAERMNTLLNNKQQRDELIREGKLHALQFRHENTIPQLMKLYNEVMQ